MIYSELTEAESEVVATTEAALLQLESTTAELELLEGTIAATIRAYLEVKRDDVGKELGVSGRTIGRIEDGKYNGREGLIDDYYTWLAGQSGIWCESIEIVTMLKGQRQFTAYLIQGTQNTLMNIELGLITISEQADLYSGHSLVSDTDRRTMYEFLKRIKRFASRLELLLEPLEEKGAFYDIAGFLLNTRIESPDYFATSEATELGNNFWATDSGELIHFRGGESLVFDPHSVSA